ncbi:N-6 DNA methylase [Brachyspira hampsonii]|uniref:N-6 DNA methylase n=1 Tax=Brachyspira hampsonii TaxID=1287055 RepID=UPI002108E66E|nr:N-6 DNA methylase [Brachyspira hampsonii]
MWYYQVNLNRNLGKTNPLNEKDLEDFINCYENKKVSENSWLVNIKDIDKSSYDLSVKNPNRNEEFILEEPEDIIENILSIEEENKNILEELKEIL